MKYLAALLILALLNGCASMAPLSYQERCAVQDMKLAGATQEESRGSAYAYGSRADGSRGGSVTIASEGHAESVQCVMPESDADRCEVKRLKEIARPKQEYNEGIGGKRFITGAGYVLWIVPGVIAKAIYDSELNQAMSGSRQIASERVECSRAPASK